MTREEFIKQTAEQQLACAGYTLRASCPPRPHNATECGWEWVAPPSAGTLQQELNVLRCAISDERLKLDDAKSKLAQAQAEFAAVRGAVVEARADLRETRRMADDALNQALKVCLERDAAVEQAKKLRAEMNAAIAARDLAINDRYKVCVERDTAMRELSAARADLSRTVEARNRARQSKERYEQDASAAIVLRDAVKAEHARLTDSILMESVRLSPPFSPWLTSDVGAAVSQVPKVAAGPRYVDLDPVRSTLAGLGPMKPGDVIVWPKRPNTNDTRDASYIRTNEGWVCLLTGTRYSVSSLDADTANWVRAKVRL